MSKINATYSSGYYIAPDVDFRKLEEQQRQEQRGKRRKPGADSADSADNVKRQTFAIPFDLICLHCNHRIARGSHVYTNRRAMDERYLDSIRIWELEILCRFCKGKYYLRTDPETPKDTGGYVCVKGCRRVEGDFYDLNKQNHAAREEWKQAKADAELDPLAALEKENEAARQLEERNRQIEEEVEQLAEHNDSDLLTMLRNRHRRRAALADTNNDNSSVDVSDGDAGPDAPSAPQSSAPSSSGFPPPPIFDSVHAAKEGTGELGDTAGADNDDADERIYREFEEDMERRWRALEREQRAQRRKEQANVNGKPMVRESEVDRVLARYGGVRRAPLSKAENSGVSEGAATLSVVTSGPTAGNGLAATSEITLAASVLPSVLRNKFLVEDDDDDDYADAPWKTQVRRASVQTARPVTSVVKQELWTSRPQASSTPRTGGSALLRNLVDSDSDDDDVP